MSSDYIVSARKYRPTTFQSVVGQKALVQTLKNAIKSGKLAHAYLFCGPRGVGKTSCARIFAKTINCEHLDANGEACNECESCKAFNEKRSYNIHELDAASNNSVDNIRELIEQVQIPPQVGRYKVFIVDEVHMLSSAAFNAFLKTLEEPPAHAIFVLATTEKHKILPTILSRCQTYDFQRISIQDIADHLAYVATQEGIQYEANALQVIARKADGGMRDALSVFDQIASFTGGNVTYKATIEDLNILDYEIYFRLTDAILTSNVPAALVLLDEVIRKGFDAQYFIGGFASHLRDLMVCKDAATASLIEAGQDVAMRYQQQAARCDIRFLYAALQIANDCDFNYKMSRNKRLSVEIALIKICQLLQPQMVQPQVSNQQPMQTPARPQPAPMPRPQAQASAPQPQASPVQRPSQPMPQAQRPMPQPVRPTSTPPQNVSSPQMPYNPRPATGAPARPRLTSLHGGATAQAQTIATGAAQSVEMNDPVDPEALRRFWKEYTQNITTERFLVNSMLACLPELVEGTTYEVTVNNQEQKDRMVAKMDSILSFLVNNLRNSHIRIQVEVASQDNLHRAFTNREKFNEMKDENGSLEELVDVFGLEFS